MPFIGKSPSDGNHNVLLDAFNATATATYNLTKDSIAYTPASAQSLMVSLNGVTQAPIAAYTVSGSTIVFASALTTDDVIDYIIGLQGPKVNATLDDDTVTTAMIKDNAITSAKIGVDVIVAEDLAANSITVSELSDNAVTQAKLADDAVGIAELAATGTANATTFLRGDNSWAASGGLYSTWAVKTDTNYTVVDSGEQIIMNSAAARTLTLPSSASAGDTVIIKNVGAGLVTVARNGLKIEGADQDGTLASTKAMQIVYVTTALGWKEI